MGGPTRICSYKDCKCSNRLPNKSFFSNPKDPDQRKVWEDNSRIDAAKLKTVFYICEDHFNTSDIRSDGVRKRLRAGSNPTQFESVSLRIENNKIEGEDEGVKKIKLDVAEQCENKNVVNKLLDGKSLEVKAFINAQLFHKPNGTWTEDERNVFSKIQYKSPSSYKALKVMGFIAPSTSTIRSWYRNIPFRTGLSEEMLNIIKDKLEVMENKRCVLLFDEMSIKYSLVYDEHNDVVCGYEDFGEHGRRDKPAKHALVFMLCGLNQQWKQVIAHFYGTASKEMMKDILWNILTKLVDAGIDVVATNCDQGSTNRGAYDELQVTPEEPYLNVNGKQVVCLYDIPHLFKSVRNNLMDHDFIVEENVVSWNILKKVYSEDNSTIRAMHKLTPAHIMPDSFQKMNVKLATQVFSGHVATSIYAATHTAMFTGEEKESAIATANFFSKLNKAFDHLSSYSTNYQNPDKAPISNKSNILESLMEIKSWISGWKKIGRKAYCFDGLVQTLNGIRVLWKIIQHNQQFLLTSRLNQDPLENTFSVIRNDRGSYERNPSCYMFHSNMKHLCFHSLMAPPNSSYDVSEAETLLNLSDVKEHSSKKYVDNIYADYVSNSSTLLTKNYEQEDIDEDDDEENYCEEDAEDEVDEEADEENFNNENLTLGNMSLSYFAGYILCAFDKKFGCEICKDAMEDTSEDTTKDVNLLIDLREYSNLRNNLRRPNLKFLKFVKALIEFFEEKFDELCFYENIIQNYVDMFISQNRYFDQCKEHKRFIVTRVFLVVLRAVLKRKNAQFKISKKRLSKLDNLNNL